MATHRLQRGLAAVLVAAGLAPQARPAGIDYGALQKEIEARRQDPEVVAWLARDAASAQRIKLLEAMLKVSTQRIRALREQANEVGRRGAAGSPRTAPGLSGETDAGRPMFGGPSAMELRMAATEEVARSQDLLVELAMAYREIKQHAEAAREDQRPAKAAPRTDI